MNKLLIAPLVAGFLLLAACNGNTSAQNAPQANAQGGGFDRQNYRQNLQQYADEANSAPDKTQLTKDQFTAEMQTLIQTQRAQFRAGSGSMMQGFGSGHMMNGQRFGSGSFMGGPRFGSGGFAGGPRGGSGAGIMQNRLATATTFYKYTDPNGNEALVALDANGQVVFHWPMPFGRRGGMMNGNGQMPAGNAPTNTVQQ